jgi:hypothetical protein
MGGSFTPLLAHPGGVRDRSQEFGGYGVISGNMGGLAI